MADTKNDYCETKLTTPEAKYKEERELKAQGEAKIAQAYLDFARKTLQDSNFNLESKEIKDRLKEELRNNPDVVSGLQALNAKKRISTLNTQFKTKSHDEAFYGCGLIKGEEDNEGSLDTKLEPTTRDQYILTDKGIWFRRSDAEEAIKLRVSDAKKINRIYDELKVSREAEKKDLDKIKGCLADPSEGVQTDRSAISPSMLSCSNAKEGFEPAQFIDPNKLIRLQDVLNKLLEANGLLKIKVGVHFVTVNGKTKPVIEYHANSGRDKASVRLAERRVIDTLTNYFLEYYDDVQVLAQLHEPAFEENDDQTGLKEVDGLLVWSKELPNVLDKFTHKITKFTAPKRVIYKPRGEFDQNDAYLGDDGFANPQIEKSGLKVWDANMYAWTASRPKENEVYVNSHVLKENTSIPPATSVVDFRKAGSNCPPHEPIILETADMTYIAFGDLSRKNKKAFKNVDDIYDKQKALKEIKHEDGTKSFVLNPEVLPIQRFATQQLYTRAANHFLALVSENKLEEKTADSLQIQRSAKLTSAQIKILVRFKELINNLQGKHKNDTPDLLDAHEFYNLFKESGSINADTVVEFTTALNNVIKTQVPFENVESNSLAQSWQTTLDEWNKDLNLLKGYLKLFPSGEKDQYLKDKKYHSEMTGSDLKALSAIPTQGGGCSPLQSLFGAFGLETKGGWNAVHGLTDPTNEMIGESLLYGKTESIAQALLLSPANEVYFTGFDAADEERSVKEIKGKLPPPSVTLPEKLGKWFGLLELCNHLCIDMGLITASSPEPKPMPAMSSQLREAKASPQLQLEQIPPISIPDEIDIKALRQSEKPQNIFWRGKMWYREANSTEVTEQPDFNNMAKEYDADLTRKTRHAYEQAVKGGSIQAKCTIVSLPDDKKLDDLETSIDNQYIIHNQTIWFRAANSKAVRECPISKTAVKLEDLQNAKFDILTLEEAELTKWLAERKEYRRVMAISDNTERAKQINKLKVVPQRAYIKCAGKLYFSNRDEDNIIEVQPDQVAQREWDFFTSLFDPKKKGNLRFYTNVNSEEANFIKWCTGHTIPKKEDKEAALLDKFFPPLLSKLGEYNFSGRISKGVDMGALTLNERKNDQNVVVLFFQDIVKKLRQCKAAIEYSPPYKLKGKRKHHTEDLLKAVLKFQQIYTLFKLQNQSESDVKPSELEWKKLAKDMEEAAKTIRASCGGLKERNREQLIKVVSLVILACFLLALSLTVLFLTDANVSGFTNELLNLGISISKEAVTKITQVAGFIGVVGSTALASLSVFTNRPKTYEFGNETELNFDKYESYCRRFMSGAVE